jgi:hypothetical protein
MRRSLIIFAIAVLLQFAGFAVILVAAIANTAAITHAAHLATLITMLVGVALILAGLAGDIWFVVRLVKFVEVQRQRVRSALQYPTR